MFNALFFSLLKWVLQRPLQQRYKCVTVKQLVFNCLWAVLLQRCYGGVTDNIRLFAFFLGIKKAETPINKEFRQL